MSLYSNLKGAGILVYSSLSSLPLVNVAEDTIARTLDTDKLYIWNGTGWYYLPPTNENPTITTGGDATYALAADGSATVVTLEANDPEGFDIVWSYVVTAGSLGSTATVTQNNNVFTITPSIVEADAGEFSLTFTASDGVNLSTSASAFSLSFVVEPAVYTGTIQSVIQNPNPYHAGSGDHFGESVDCSDTHVIIGAPLGVTNQVGVAYIYNTSGELVHTLNNPINVASDFFGYSVGISDSYAIVGAWVSDQQGSQSGSAYIFSVATGALISTLDSFSASKNRFGTSVDISDSYAAVGSPFKNGVESQEGEVEVFNPATGALLHTFPGPGGNAFGSRFGTDVKIYGTDVYVGAIYDQAAAGRVYVYGATNGALRRVYDNPNPAQGGTAGIDNFGKRIDASENYVIIASPQEDTPGADQGLAYIFQAKAPYSLLHTISVGAGSTLSEMGVGITDSYAVVSNGSVGNGIVKVYSMPNATLVGTINTPTDAKTFGESVAISDYIGVVGAPDSDVGSTDTGTAYLFT